jgi:hypothetical protein
VHDGEREALTSSTEAQGDRSGSQGDRREVHKDAQDQNEVHMAQEKQAASSRHSRCRRASIGMRRVPGARGALSRTPTTLRCGEGRE